MSVPVKVIFDCATGLTQEIPLTAEEIADMEAKAAESLVRYEAEEAARAAAEAARESGRAKLAALGLTEAEIASLVK